MFLLSCGDDKPMIIDDTPFVFPEIIKVYNDIINEQPVVTIGSMEQEFMVSYFRELDSQVHTFDVVQGKFPIVMKDENGDLWDVFGNNTSSNNN